MKIRILTLALAGFFAMPAAAQDATGMAQSTTAVKVQNKVSESLANSVKVSGDSAMKIARANADFGEVSSAELQMKDKHLVYEIKLLNKSKRTTEVSVDAMTGDVIENKEYGGLKATVLHHKENNKLLDAKRDSAAKNP